MYEFVYMLTTTKEKEAKNLKDTKVSGTWKELEREQGRGVCEGGSPWCSP